jgi:hypothetical protein
MPSIEIGEGLRWFLFNQNLAPGTDLFICSHGGWDGGSWTKVPGNSTMYFWNYNGKTITADVCNQIMQGNNTLNTARGRQGYDPRSIGSGGSSVWDYMLDEFPGDWHGATASVSEANLLPNPLRYDCVMIKPGVTLRLADVLDQIQGYSRYHLMACRVSEQYGYWERPSMDVRKV